MSRSTIPAPVHAPGDALHGFRIEQVTEISDIKALAYEAVHERTGAKILHVHCNDEENMFSVGFRTPPPDSTGVAHILEHSVLAGSKRYPVQDAFNELMKRTLTTFINAMTWPDRTIYPTCSAVKADYFNLASVYTDLVFNPLITRRTFQQEGHHLEFEGEGTDGPLTITGVVYNEMKGAYSSPESVVGRHLRRSLLCDTPYGFDSGGDPEVMPELTYEAFVRFHESYYSPSNARFMFYGDVTLAENLAFLEGALAPFERVEVDSALPLQTRWDAPRRSSIFYPIGAEDDTNQKTFVVVAWMLNETTEVGLNLALDIAFDALVGSAAGPLRQALVDSGLGQDVYPAHYSDDGRQAVASVGLRGTDADKAEEIEVLILDTLREVAAAGLDSELIEGSMHQIELSGKEISPPFPIWLLVRAAGPWFSDADPKWGLQFGQLIDGVREKYAADPKYFDNLITEWLVDNPHRVRLTVCPSTTLTAERDARFRDRMTARKAQLGTPELDTIEAEATALREAQQMGEDPKALASLPTLSPSDIPAEPREVPVQTREALGAQVHEHEVFSNGIGYLGLSFDVRDIDDDLAPYLPLLGRATCGMGAAGLSYAELSRRISRTTGGLSSSRASGRHIGTGDEFARFNLGGTVLHRNAAELTSVLIDVMTRPDPSDTKRLGDLINESASRAVSQMVPAGHRYALLRAAASLSRSLWRREQWQGSTQVAFLRGLARDGLEKIGHVSETIAALQKQVFTRSRLFVNVGGDPEIIATLRPLVDALIEALPAGTPVAPAAAGSPPISRHAGVVIPAEVNYVGQVMPVPDISDAAAPALGLLSSILKSDYLYQKLRVQGGAYGGFSMYLAESGLMAMLSYRDPHLLETLEVYKGVLDYVDGALDDTAVEASRIGTIGDFDRILAPGQQVEVARNRHLYGITAEHRKAYRAGLLSIDAAGIRERAVPLLAAALEDAPRAVVASQTRLDEANLQLGGALELSFPQA